MIAIDGYTDLRRVGAGGVGDVYRAVKTGTGDVVAIKVLRDVADGSAAWRRARRELAALTAVAGHPNIVGLVEVLELATGPALVVEYAPRGSIAERLAREGGSLALPEAVFVGRQAATALAGAHAAGVVHRDVKPHNLLIDGDGQIKLCDFGIATLTQSAEFGDRTSAVSPRYASPEDLDDDGDVTAAADVYSLGATLLHLVHGAPPTAADRAGPWVPTRTAHAELAAVDEIIAACLAPAPGDRPTAAEVLDRLAVVDLTLARRCHAIPIEGARNEAPEVEHEPADDVGGWLAELADEPADQQVEDDTIVRGDRPPTILRPPVGEPRRRWPWAVAAVGVAAALGVVTAAVWPRPSQDEALNGATANGATATVDTTTTAPTTAPAAAPTTAPPRDAIATVARPAGLGALDPAATQWPFGDPGDCLVQVNGLDELMPVDCGEPHDLQRFAIGRVEAVLDGDDTSFPVDAIQAHTEQACRDRFAAFVGVVPADSSLHIAVTRPSPATWADGDRRFQCLIGVPEHHLIGDAEGSAA